MNEFDRENQRKYEKMFENIDVKASKNEFIEFLKQKSFVIKEISLVNQ